MIDIMLMNAVAGQNFKDFDIIYQTAYYSGPIFIEIGHMKEIWAIEAGDGKTDRHQDIQGQICAVTWSRTRLSIAVWYIQLVAHRSYFVHCIRST